jgi:sec-independent protein translocase protein TatB
MFGMGFTEILFIAVVAILFLGPDKLPEAMVQIAKLFKSISKTVNEAKSSFEEEIHIKELREEALNYRKQYENATNDISGFKNSIPNPVTELQDAVSSIGGDRYLDEDILADIEESETRSEEANLEEVEETETIEAEETTKEIIEEKPKSTPKKKSPKKPTAKSKKSTKVATKQKVKSKKTDTEEPA